jgi:aspartate aminotransferase-like enzyme
VATPNLRLTGPTPLPPQVREAQTRQMVSHRSAEFRALLSSVLARLAPLFGTADPVVAFTASGTGGMEASVLNCVRPGGRVLAVSIGHFGERFAQIARIWGAAVETWDVGWGSAADPDELARRIRAAGRLDAVLVTHNEGSTGVLNPLGPIAAAVRSETDALLIVDAVSSVGATEVRMDDWGIDVVVTASQKALMSPPGLALVAVGDRAGAVARSNPAPRFYFDFARMIAAARDGMTAYTPAVSVVYALDAALRIIEAEGAAAVFDRHRRHAAACRARGQKAGLRPCAPALHASPSVTAFALPAGIRAADVRQRLQAEHGVVVSQGRGSWKDSVIRVGHMGWTAADELDAAMDALGEVVGELGAGVDVASPLEANL